MWTSVRPWLVAHYPADFHQRRVRGRGRHPAPDAPGRGGVENKRSTDANLRLHLLLSLSLTFLILLPLLLLFLPIILLLPIILDEPSTCVCMSIYTDSKSLPHVGRLLDLDDPPDRTGSWRRCWRGVRRSRRGTRTAGWPATRRTKCAGDKGALKRALNVREAEHDQMEVEDIDAEEGKQEQEEKVVWRTQRM